MMFGDPDTEDLTAAIVNIAEKHRRSMRDMEFNSYMKRLDKLTPAQQLTLFQALVERLACA
jgi:hypothetical protein